MSKQLLIVETSVLTTADLEAKKDAKGFIVLEGIFGEIGVKNKNNRIYDATEYVPQIESLQSDIKKNKLVGELDHPKQFEISLANVSHVIEKLEYNKDTKQVTGRIRLLDTTKGKEAQALIEGGIPLHISSRAAGQVMENGHVKINKLFTYDLVANPGFENAELKRVNEAYGFDNDDSIQIYEMNENSNLIKDNTISDQYINKNNSLNMSSISQEDFKNYSDYTKENILNLQNEIKSLKAIKETASAEDPKLVAYIKKVSDTLNQVVENVNELNNKFAGVITHSNHIAETTTENFNNLFSWTNHIAEQADKGIEYTKHVAERADQGIEYSKMLAEKADQGIEYTKHVAERADQGIEYSKMLAEKADQGIEYTKHVAERADQGIEYSKMVAEKTDQVIAFSDLLKENIENNRTYLRYIAEKSDQGIEYTKHVAERADFGIRYAEALNENQNNIIDKTEQIIAYANLLGEKASFAIDYAEFIKEHVNYLGSLVVEGDVTPTTIVESTNYETVLNEKLNTIIESAKKQKAETENPDVHFLKFVDATKRNQFEILSEEQKANVVETFRGKTYFSSAQANAIFESTFVTKTKTLNFIESMPLEYRESWNNLTESQQNAIKAQAQYHPVATQYQINNFWETRDLRPTKVSLEKLNENQIALTNTNEQHVISNGYMSSFEEEMKRRFNK